MSTSDHPDAHSPQNYRQLANTWYVHPTGGIICGLTLRSPDVDVIAVAFSEGLCHLIPYHKNIFCDYEGDLKDDMSNDTSYGSTEYGKRIHRKLGSTVEFIR
eukprot:Selendium_serpulae@DN6516_c2_g7_i4.p1